ncbi:Trigger factor [Rickettsiales bacterium Ac37b]|nr:Trigger factor [Rickettsiales bacterium Ac37b]
MTKNNFQVTELNNEGLKRAYKIVIQSEILNQKLEDRINEAAKSAKIDGFRPGKVPVSVIKNKYNESLQAEVVEKLIDDSLKQFMEEKKPSLAEQPKIEIKEFKLGENFEYQLSFEVLPDITIPDYSNISIEKLVCEPTEEDIEERLKKIATTTLNYVKSDKTVAESGDTVIIDFEGKINGVAFAQGSAQDMKVELGAGRLLPDFEKQLIGASINQPLQIILTFPNDYMAKDLAGKEAEFSTTIKEILAGIPYEINDELALKLGLDNLDALKGKVKEALEQEWKQASNTYTRKKLFDQLEKKCDFPIPTCLEEREFNSLWQRISEIKKTDPSLADKTDEELQTLYRKMAIRRVKLGILLTEIGKQHNLSITQEDLRQAVYAQSRMFPGQEHAVLDYYRKNPKAVEQLKGPIVEDKAVELLLSQITTTEKMVGYSELLELSDIKDEDM